MKTFNPNLSVPEEISRKALDLKMWMETHNAESIYGMGNVSELQRQLADARLEAETWKAAHDNGRWVYRDIGSALGADMPRELVGAVARRRMAELAAVTAERDTLRSALELADALRNHERGLDKC